jgi:hypothetical protein
MDISAGVCMIRVSQNPGYVVKHCLLFFIWYNGVMKQNSPKIWFYYMDDNKEMRRTSKAEMWFKAGPLRKSVNFETQISKGIRVSTVFVGLGFNAGKPPMLFETMIVGGKRHGEAHRYATITEAEKGHKQIVKSLVSIKK